VLIIVIAVASSGGGNSNDSAGTSAQGNAQQPAGQMNTSSPAPEQTTSAPPAAPQYTASQQQAIDAAQSYLSMGSGFSYQGLIDQLDSPDGNGFSTADAASRCQSRPGGLEPAGGARRQGLHADGRILLQRHGPAARQPVTQVQQMPTQDVKTRWLQGCFGGTMLAMIQADQSNGT